MRVFSQAPVPSWTPVSAMLSATRVKVPSQGSVTVNVGAASCSAAGLHPRLPPSLEAVMTGALGLTFHVYVTLTVSAFWPQVFSYVAVHTFVCVHPLVVSTPLSSVTCGLVAHTSVTLKLSTVRTGMSARAGLQPRSRTAVPLTAVMTGVPGSKTIMAAVS